VVRVIITPQERHPESAAETVGGGATDKRRCGADGRCP
jgi:hypothetical protein